MTHDQSYPEAEAVRELVTAGLRHAEGLTAQLAKLDWRPGRAHIEQARNSIQKLAELLDQQSDEVGAYALALEQALHHAPAQTPTVGVLHDIYITMRHARTFITTREKMHPTGVELWDKLSAQVEALQASSVSSTGREFPTDPNDPKYNMVGMGDAHTSPNCGGK